ncbi:MAG: tetratricopeptide repeat protein [Planctomycetota bacterium]
MKHLLFHTVVRSSLLLLPMTVKLGLVGCSAPQNESSRQVVVELSGDPQTAQLMFERGVQAVHLQELDQAEKLFLQAIEADPTHGPAHNNLGKIYFQQDRLQDAAVSFQSAIEFMPFRPEPANNLGLVLEIGLRLDDAIKQYEAAITLDPDDPDYLTNLVRARIKRGDDDARLRQQLWQIADNDKREVWVEWARQQIQRLD